MSRAEVEAYDLVLQARFALGSPTPESIARAGTILDRALQLAPDYAPAWAERGLQYSRIRARALTVESRQQAAAAGRKALQHAIELDPRLAVAHSRLAGVEVASWNFAAAERSIARALELDPTNNIVRGNAAYVFASLGRIEEAISLESAITQSDPLDALNFTNLALHDILLNRLDSTSEGCSSWRLTHIAHSSFSAPFSCRSETFPPPGRLGHEPTSSGGRETAVGSGPQPSWRLRPGTSPLPELRCESSSDVSERVIPRAWLRSTLGAAMRMPPSRLWTARGRARSWPGGLHLDLFLRSLHDDPRWKDLLRKVGLPTR